MRTAVAVLMLPGLGSGVEPGLGARALDSVRETVRKHRTLNRVGARLAGSVSEPRQAVDALRSRRLKPLAKHGGPNDRDVLIQFSSRNSD